MAALAEIRENEIRIDMTVTPIEEAYAMLHKYAIVFKDGNAERVDSLPYQWRLLIQKASGAFSPPESVSVTEINRVRVLNQWTTKLR